MRRGFHTWFERYGTWLTEHRTVSLATFMVLVVGVGYGVTKLEVDFSARDFFGGDKELIERLDTFIAQWGPDDRNLAIVFEKRSGSMLDDDGIALIEKVSSVAEKHPGVGRVLSLSKISLPYDAGGMVEFATPTSRRPKTDDARKQWEKEILADEILSPNFISADKTRSGALLELKVNGDDIDALRPVVEDIQKVLGALATDKITIRFAGDTALRAALMDLVVSDQLVFVPLAFGLMALLLLLLYRRFHGVAIPLFNAALPSFLVMGCLGYASVAVGLVNQVYFTLLPVIAVSGSIHFLARYYEEASADGFDSSTLRPNNRTAVVVRTLRAVGPACFFSAFTTVIGFASLTVSEMPVLSNFGRFSALGVTFAFLVLVVVIPIYLTVGKGRVLVSNTDPEKRARVDAVFAKIADFTFDRPLVVVGVFSLLMVASAYYGQRVIADNTLSGLLGQKHPVKEAADIVDKDLGGVVTLEVAFDSQKPGTFNEPNVLRALGEMERVARTFPEVKSAQSPAVIVRRINRAVVGVDAVPDEAATVAQLLFLAEGFKEVSSLLSDDRAHARMILRSQDVGCNAFVRLTEELSTKFRGILHSYSIDPSSVVVTFTGTTYTSYLGINQLAEELRSSVLLTFLTIFIVIAILFGKLSPSLIVLVPNAIPLMIGYGFIGAAGWTLEPAPAVVFSIALGIAVDDGIHLMVRTDEEYVNGRTLREAVRHAVVGSGRPVVMTTIILTAGFGVNMLSTFPTNARLGTLGALVIGVAVLADLILLPAILALVDPRRKYLAPEASPNE